MSHFPVRHPDEVVVPPWSSHGPTNPVEAWNFQRRTELGGFAVPILLSLMRDEPKAGALPDDSWKEEPSPRERRAADRALATRAAEFALAIQDALDRACPRA